MTVHPRLSPPPIVGLVTSGLLLAAITILYVLQDTAIAPPTDSAHHLFSSLLFSRALALGGLPELWETMRAFYVGWPPASYLFLYGPLGFLFSEQSQCMRLYSLALVPLLLLGTYRLAGAFLDRRWATLAAVLSVFSLGIAGQLRQVSIDLPATTAVLLCMLALHKSNGFKDQRGCLLLGAATGLCLLTRVQAVFFIAGPLFASALVGLLSDRSLHGRLHRLQGLALAGLVAALISAPWWGGRLPALFSAAFSHLDPTQIAPRGDPAFGPGLVYYTLALGKLAGWPLLVLAAASVPLLGRRASRGTLTPGLGVLLPWIVGGILGCALGVHREPRYLLPAVPALVILALLGLASLRPRWRNPAGALLLATGVLPTGLFAAFPVQPNDAVARLGLVEWGYVRAPIRVKAEQAGRAVSVALSRVNDMDTRGQGIYLLLQPHAKQQFLPRLASFLVPRMPDLAFSSLVNLAVVNTRGQRRERARRRLFVLSEGEERLGLPLIWETSGSGYGNQVPIRLYRVPAGSPLYGPIERKPLPERTRGRPHP